MRKAWAVAICYVAPVADTNRPTLTLIDGSSYIFRAYHAIRTELATSKGLPTRAVFGFTRMLLKSLREASPTHVAVVWDRDGKTLRQAIDPQYKAQRPEAPDDLKVQFPWIRKVVDALAVPNLEKAGWEADDVIATLVHQAVERGFDVVIVTGDKDFSQLVGAHVKLYDGMTDKWTGPDEVREKWGVPVEKFLELQTLLGDAIDNVPGVPGVGPKTAADLIAQYGDVDAVIAACDRGEVSKKKVAAAICEAKDQLARNKELVRLRTDVELELGPDDLQRRQPDPGPVQQLFRDLEFYGLLRELPAVLPTLKGVQAETPQDAAPVAPADAFPLPATELVTDEAAFARLLERIRAADHVGLRAAPPIEPVHAADLVGVALAIPGGPSAYVPVGHRGMFVGPQLDRARVVEGLRTALAGKPWYGSHTKRDLMVLYGAGLDLHGATGDAELAAYLLNPVRRTFETTDLAREKLACDVPEYGTVAGVGKERKAFCELEPKAAGDFMGATAACAAEVAQRLLPELDEAGLVGVYRELELPLVRLLAHMERLGIRLDTETLAALGKELDEKLAVLLKRCFEHAGREFNVGSPKQLAQVLFEELHLPVIKRSKTGPSTDHEVLEKLAEQHELPKAVLEYRSLSKLKGTYVDALPLLVAKDGRLHTTFEQSNTATGRLASSDPNLMNIPIRTEEGRRIRESFVADPGFVLVSADYSQIELRILAHVTGDPGLVDALRSGADVHARTAAEVFSVAVDAVTADQRRIAKMINYAVAYGLSAFGLSTRLDIPPGEAAAIIKAYFERYAGVKSWIDRIIAEAKANGFVTTLDGRRRFLPDLGSRNPALRQAAERAAINMPIQGTAADIMKRAMIRVEEALRNEGADARLLLQVHDELVLEVREGQVDRIAALVREAMEGAASLEVPLVVDVGQGANWAVAH